MPFFSTHIFLYVALYFPSLRSNIVIFVSKTTKKRTSLSENFPFFSHAGNWGAATPNFLFILKNFFFLFARNPYDFDLFNGVFDVYVCVCESARSSKRTHRYPNRQLGRYVCDVWMCVWMDRWRFHRFSCPLDDFSRNFFNPASFHMVAMVFVREKIWLIYSGISKNCKLYGLS